MNGESALVFAIVHVFVDRARDRVRTLESCLPRVPAKRRLVLAGFTFVVVLLEGDRTAERERLLVSLSLMILPTN